MTWRRSAVLVVLCAAIFCPSLLSAQSPPDVDCDAAKTRVEQTVCAAPDLVALEEIIVDGYIQTLPLSDSPAREVQQRFRWLQRRDDCNQERDEMLVSCVRSAYEERAREITLRLEELNATVATQIAQAADTGAAQQGALDSVANPDLSPSAAQSPPDVDCDATKTRVEQTVCAAPDLVALGEIIVDGYIQTLPLSDSPAREVQQRFRWLQRRDDCNQERDEMLISCVRSAYEERAREITSRLEELNPTVATQIAQAADTGAAQQGALGSVANPDLLPSEEGPIAVQPIAQVPSESTTSETTETELAVTLAFLGLIAVAGIGLIWGVFGGAIRMHRYARRIYGYSPFSLGILFVILGLNVYFFISLLIFTAAADGADTGSVEAGQAVLILLAPGLLVLALTYFRVCYKTNWWISAFSVSVLLIVSPLLLVFVSSLLRKGTAWLDGDNAA